MTAELVGHGAGSAITRTRLSGVLRVGAAPDNELCLGQPGVAPYHARVVCEDAGYFVEPASNDATVTVNGVPAGRARLDNLDVVTLADDVDFVFLHSAQRPGEPAGAASERPAIDRVMLEWMNGPDEGATVPVPRGELIVGRGESCGLSVNAPALSRTHARITFDGETVTVADAGSVNGTTVNDRRIDAVVLLDDGDRITFGRLRTVKVVIHRASGAPASDPAMRPPAIEGTVLDLQWRSKLIWSGPEDAEVAGSTPAQGVAGPATVLAGPGRAPGPPVFAPSEGDRTNFVRAQPVAPPVVPRFDVGPQTSMAAPAGGVEPPPMAPLANEAKLPANDPETMLAGRPGSEGSSRGTRVREISGARLRGTTQSFSLAIGRSTVGRAVDADVKLASRTVSRAHAIIEVTRAEVVVEDLGGDNGTEVNGVRIKGRRALAPGDRLGFAEEKFTVEIFRDETR